MHELVLKATIDISMITSSFLVYIFFKTREGKPPGQYVGTGIDVLHILEKNTQH